MPTQKLNTMSLKKDTNIFVLPKNGYICTLIFVSFFENEERPQNDI